MVLGGPGVGGTKSNVTSDRDKFLQYHRRRDRHCCSVPGDKISQTKPALISSLGLDKVRSTEYVLSVLVLCFANAHVG